MDSAIGNSKQSCCRHAKITEQHSDDRFSNLPFDMLYHILSFLDTREAVGTSLLSRTWRYIWSSVPRLNFNCKCSCMREPQFKDLSICPCSSKFWEFVKRTLIIRETPPIHALHFSCDYFEAAQVRLLLYLCDARNVQELDIFARSHLQVRKLPRVFAQFLLDMIQNSNGLHNLSLTSFNNLKRLRLVRVRFHDDLFTRKLFSDCGILEDLSLEYCCFMMVTHFNISSHKLRNLTFVNMGPFNKITSDCNLRLSLKVDAPHLLSFCYIGPVISVSEFSNMSCLNHALIQVPNQSCPRSCSGLAIMISDFVHAKGLTLSAAFVRCFSPACSWLLRNVYLFDRLTVMRLELVCKPDYVEGFINLLRISPELRVLGIKFVKSRGRSAWKSREDDVPCFSRRFKEIEITKFLDSACSMEVIKFFLQNAKSLEKIKIIQKKEVDEQKFYALQAVPLASEAVSVSFVSRSASGEKELLQFVYKKCRVGLWKWIQEKKSKSSVRMRYAAAKLGVSLGKRGRSYMWQPMAQKKLRRSM